MIIVIIIYLYNVFSDTHTCMHVWTHAHTCTCTHTHRGDILCLDIVLYCTGAHQDFLLYFTGAHHDFLLYFTGARRRHPVP